MKVFNLLKTKKLLHNKISKSIILFVSLGLSSLNITYGMQEYKPNPVE